MQTDDSNVRAQSSFSPSQESWGFSQCFIDGIDVGKKKVCSSNNDIIMLPLAYEGQETLIPC